MKEEHSLHPSQFASKCKHVYDGVWSYLSGNATQGFILRWKPVFQRGTLSPRALCPHVVAPPMMCKAREHTKLYVNA